ncbi:alpha/beta fold hydrolase [Amnibacterium kyonggiense]|uniref:Pimeloyl-ACP methyl ester carboxylesterase n=1 Tax=Amnibacterium kyonggiense TaxID=595671 RepID=A0A4R7FL78_9MICO|nr:alpha/beta hydrolase [Amnibacterium kyonggiense]TDS77118.1 pimeloyl-ACP methyl ester carboxylesterase [Amnibacterium kyonggiense]
MPIERFDVPRPDGSVLAGVRRRVPGGTPVVLLHSGVTDRRSWLGVIDELEDDPLDLIAVDRRGYGETPGGPEGFTHLEDLVAVLDAAGAERAVVVGNSMGGALALDLALTAPERVASVLLIGAAVTGMTDEGEPIAWTVDDATGPILGALERAEQAHDVEEAVRLELHLWLDGPTSPEGRVGGATRELAAEMNRRILTAGTQGGAGAADLDTWHRLGEVRTPVLATWGDLDLPPDLPFYELTAQRLANAEARVLEGVAHLPSLERPALVADLIREAVDRA